MPAEENDAGAGGPPDEPQLHVTATGLRAKGLRRNSVPLVAAVAIGLAATAPAYSLTGALGWAALESGYQLPIIFILSVIPMYFVALAYKHMTTVAPDSGTVFTWAAKAIGPRTGWFGGWGLMLSSVLAGVGAAEIMANAVVAMLDLEDPPALLRTGVACFFILFTTWLVARGAQESSRTTLALTIVQFGGLAVFVVVLIQGVREGSAAETAEEPSWEWFNPAAIDGWSALLGGFLVALFIFWGFDSALAMSEESQGTPEQAGRTGVIAMMIILVAYVIFSVVALAYAGIDEEDPRSLTHPDNIDDVFTALASEAVGRPGVVVAALIVGLSAFSATMSTVMPTARGLLAMATYRALPSRFATMDEATQSPVFATWFLGLMTLAIYGTLSLVSESIVADMVYSVGISISAYYTVAALACVWYFHSTAFTSVRTAFSQVILPAIGAGVLIFAGLIEGRNMMDPEYGSGASVAGIGAVFVVGVLMLLLGVPLMELWRSRAPEFFRGKTLRREQAHWVPTPRDDA